MLYGLIVGAFSKRLGRPIPNPTIIRLNAKRYPHVVGIRYTVQDTINGYRQRVFIEGRWNVRKDTFSFLMKDTGNTSIRKMKAEEFSHLTKLNLMRGEPVASKRLIQYFENLD